MPEDVLLSLGALALELGMPLSLAFLWIKRPQLRSRIVVLLGSITPFLVLYAWVATGYIGARTRDNQWALYAMWLMSLLPFVLCTIIGAAIGFLRWPLHLVARYIMGLMAPLLVWGALSLRS
jgi:hypothetical protein